MRTAAVALAVVLVLGSCKSRVSSALVVEHPTRCSAGDCVVRRATAYVPGSCAVKQPVPRDLQPDERVVACVEDHHLEPASFPAVWVTVGLAAFLAIGAAVILH